MLNIRILQWNFRSIRNKVNILNCTLFFSPDILVLQETCLRSDSYLDIPPKILYRLDRCVRPGGGLLIAVNASFSSSRLPDFFSSSGKEIMGIQFSVGSCYLNIVNVYSRSSNINDDLQAYFYSLQGPSLILGDFNLHHQFWGALGATRASEVFPEWLNANCFSIINTTEKVHMALNGLSILLDLSLCSSALFCRFDFRVENSFGSDHFSFLSISGLS